MDCGLSKRLPFRIPRCSLYQLDGGRGDFLFSGHWTQGRAKNDAKASRSHSSRGQTKPRGVHALPTRSEISFSYRSGIDWLFFLGIWLAKLRELSTILDIYLGYPGRESGSSLQNALQNTKNRNVKFFLKTKVKKNNKHRGKDQKYLPWL